MVSSANAGSTARHNAITTPQPTLSDALLIGAPATIARFAISRNPIAAVKRSGAACPCPRQLAARSVAHQPAVQRAAIDVEAAGRLRLVAAAVLEHALDVLPDRAIE